MARSLVPLLSPSGVLCHCSSCKSPISLPESLPGLTWRRGSLTFPARRQEAKSRLQGQGSEGDWAHIGVMLEKLELFSRGQGAQSGLDLLKLRQELWRVAPAFKGLLGHYRKRRNAGWAAGWGRGRAGRRHPPAGSRGFPRQDNFLPHILPFGLSLCGRRERKGAGWEEGFQRRLRRNKSPNTKSLDLKSPLQRSLSSDLVRI